jgi:hypothetical protein
MLTLFALAAAGILLDAVVAEVIARRAYRRMGRRVPLLVAETWARRLA